MSSKDHENTWKLLHPELLSRDELLCTLRERHVKVDEKIPQEKDQLVELFKKIAMPQVQRSCFKVKTTKMEFKEHQERKPSMSIFKLNHSYIGYELRQNLDVQGTSSCARASSSYNNPRDVADHLDKINIKRSSSEMSEHYIKDGTNPRKREKITWP